MSTEPHRSAAELCTDGFTRFTKLFIVLVAEEKNGQNCIHSNRWGAQVQGHYCFLGSKLAAFCSLALLCGSVILGAIIYTVCCCSRVLSFCYGAPVDTSYAPGP